MSRLSDAETLTKKFFDNNPYADVTYKNARRMFEYALEAPGKDVSDEHMEHMFDLLLGDAAKSAMELVGSYRELTRRDVVNDIKTDRNRHRTVLRESLELSDVYKDKYPLVSLFLVNNPYLHRSVTPANWERIGYHISLAHNTGTSHAALHTIFKSILPDNVCEKFTNLYDVYYGYNA